MFRSSGMHAVVCLHVIYRKEVVLVQEQASPPLQHNRQQTIIRQMVKGPVPTAIAHKHIMQRLQYASPALMSSAMPL